MHWMEHKQIGEKHVKIDSYYLNSLFFSHKSDDLDLIQFDVQVAIFWT